MPLPDTFTVIRTHPRWAELSLPEQTQLREAWVQQRLLASGDPRNEKLYKQLVQEAYADLPKEAEAKSNFWWGGHFLPPTEEYVPRMLKFVDRLGRVFSAPQQFLQSAFRQPPERAVTERIAAPFAETVSGLTKDIMGKERELQYPYKMYTDPLMLYGALQAGKRLVPSAIKRGAKIVGRVKGRVKPPISKGMPWEEIPGKVPPLRTVGRPQPEIPIRQPGQVWQTTLRQELRSTYNRAVPKLTPHFPKEQAQLVADFVARHPEDVISKAVLGKGPITVDVVEAINTRLLSAGEEMRKVMPSMEEATKSISRIRSPRRIKPPTTGIKEPIPAGEITDPGYLADAIEALAKE